VRSRLKPSSVKRLRRLLTSSFMGLVIFMLLIVLAMVAWFCLNSPVSISIELLSATSTEISSPAFWFSKVVLTCYQIISNKIILYNYKSIAKVHHICSVLKYKHKHTWGLWACEAPHEPSSGLLCSSRQTWRGVTDAEICSEILLFNLLLVGFLQEKHIPINSQNMCFFI